MRGDLRRLRRMPEHGVVAGVCAGIADYFDWNVRLLRAILVVTFIFSGFFPVVVIYLVLWYVMEPTHAPAFAASAGGFREDAPAPPRSPTLGEVKDRFTRLDERLRRIEECVTDQEFELRRELKKLES